MNVRLNIRSAAGLSHVVDSVTVIKSRVLSDGKRRKGRGYDRQMDDMLTAFDSLPDKDRKAVLLAASALADAIEPIRIARLYVSVSVEDKP